MSPISEPDGSNKLIYNRPFAQNPDSYNIYRHTQPFSDISKPPPLATGIKQLSYVDLPLSDGKYYYAVTAVLGSTESPLSEVRSAISSRNKSKADPSKQIPVDVAIYAESTCWIQIPEAEDLANAIIQNIGNKVNDVRIVSSGEFPEWILSHTKNGQPDIIILFGDFPDSIYPSGNEEPDNSLAELFLDDGNIFLNTADYIFYGMDRNNTEGLVNMIDVQTTMWGDNTHVTVTDAGRKFIPFLQDFTTDRPLHIAEFAGTDWEVEVSFADNGTNLADPAIIRNKKTGGRVGIIFQTLQTLSYVSSARAEVISEIVLNWLPTALSNIILYSGWNMVSFPGTLSNPSVDAIIPQGSNIIPPLYTYDPASFSYKEVTEVKPGEGYWILSLADEYLRADMIAPMTGITLDLKLGWNMIGGVNGTVDFTIPQDDPDNSVIPPIYTYNPTSFGYEERTSIQPGIGYWVLALQECSLTLNSNAAPPRNKAVRTYTAEPDWIVPIQAVTGKSIKEIVLGVQSNASDSFDPYIDKAMPPKASMVSTQPEISFLVKDQLVTYISRDIRIPSGRHIVIITLKDRIPSNPELLQNYPNPFNPETWIPYQLSEAGKVVISIYDVNGHLVRKLDLGNKEAGIYATKEKAVYWDGRNESGERVSSGVYFYQIQSDKFSKVMKLVVIK